MAKEKTILHYEGLYGDASARHSPEYIFLELIATRSKLFNWSINTHVHLNLFQLFVIERGSVVFQTETGSTTCNTSCLFLVPPAILHGLDYSPDVYGHILTLSETLVEEIFPTSSPIWQTFNQAYLIRTFEETSDFHSFKTLIQSIEFELFSDKAERIPMLKALFATLIIKLHRLVKQDEDQKMDNLTMGHFRRFQKQIKSADFPKSIPQFAAELNITPVHLNRICRTVAGKSAIQLVQEHLIGEGKKYLIHTSYSVSEIAYLLKFEYPNYFARLFKKYTGVSPVEFRERQRIFNRGVTE
jgi:AraC family transcriptional activator of pobA